MAAPGALKGTRLGLGRLGRTRAGERRSARARRVTRGRVDRWCVRGGGQIRIGYNRQSRVVLVLTSSRHASVGGVKVGQRARTLRRRLRGEHRLRVGKRTWYAARRGRSRLLFELTPKGRVAQVGIADLRPTRRAAAQRAFLRGFQL